MGSPNTIVTNRDKNHHMNDKVMVQLFMMLNQKIKMQSEEENDQLEGAQSQGGTSGNTIRGYAKNNPKASQYESARMEEFDKLWKKRKEKYGNWDMCMRYICQMVNTLLLE